MELDSYEWFGDPSYWASGRSLMWNDRILRNTSRDVANIIDLLEISEGDSLLDLACGFGRHSLLFAEFGVNVTGVDLNPSFINEAKQEAIKQNKDIRFTKADMREYVERNSFDHIVILYNSFGYFSEIIDNRQVIQNCLTSLKPKGKLLVSAFGREINKRVMPNRRRSDWVEEDGVFHLNEVVVDEERKWGGSRRIVIAGNDRKVTRSRMRLFSSSELTGMISDAGFCNVRAFGSLDGSEYDESATGLFGYGQKQ